MRRFISSLWRADLARSSGMIFLASLFGSLIVFVADLFISNVLGPEQFGVFRTVFYLFAFIPVLIEMGVNVTLTKYIAEFKKTEKKRIGFLVKWLLKVKATAYSIMLCIVFLLREQLALLLLKDASLSYLIMPGILLAGSTFFLVFQFIVLGYQKFKLYSLSSFLSLALSASLGVLLSGFGLFYIIFGWSLGYLIGNLFNIRFFFKEKTIRDGEEFDVKRIFVKFSLPLYLIGILVYLYNIIVPTLSLFFPHEAIGYFSFAFLFYVATLLIPTAIAMVVFPKVSELNGLKRHGHAKGILKKAFMLYGTVTVMGLAFVFLFSDTLFNTIFVGYLPSLFMFKVLVSLGLLFGFNMIYTNYLQGLGRVKLFAALLLLQNALLFAVSFALLSL